MAYDKSKDCILAEIGSHPVDDRSRIVVQLVQYDGGPVKVDAKLTGTKRDGSAWYRDPGRLEVKHAAAVAALYAKAVERAAELAAPPSAEASGRVVRRRAAAPAPSEAIAQ